VERSNHPLKRYKVEMQAHKLCEEVALGSFSREHIAEYLDATFAPNNFPPELSSLVHEKTEGHPLFATNLLQYLGERGDIANTNGRWSLVRPLAEMELEAPESVRSMIGKKIDALEKKSGVLCSTPASKARNFFLLLPPNCLVLTKLISRTVGTFREDASPGRDTRRGGVA